MTDTRTRILERVRAALSDVPAEELPAHVHVPRDYHRAGSSGRDRLVDLFAERAADYRAEVVRTAEESVPGEVERLIAPRNTLVVPCGLPEHYLPASGRLTLLRDDPPLSIGALDTAHGTITTCALAIAETGTIVLDAGPGQGHRALTLLPDYHLCLVRTEQIVATVPDAIARLDPRRPLTMISGPSATSDIENSRVEGVHGPRTLHILIIEPDEPGTQP